MSKPDKSELRRFEQIKMELWMNAFTACLSDGTTPTDSCAEYADQTVDLFAQRFDPRYKTDLTKPTVRDYLDGQEEFNFEKGAQ